MPTTRRDFLRLSSTSALLLSSGAITAGLAGCSSRRVPAAGYRFLREPELALFRALAPVVLDRLLPEADRETHLKALLVQLDDTCSRLQAPGQKQLGQLFDLLGNALTRRIATGVAAPWERAERAQVERFVRRWQRSSIGLFNAGYRGLAKLVTASWMQLPAGAASAGYPGPWAPMFAVVNA